MSEMVNLSIDGQSVTVEAGTLIIRAAEKAGIHIPRFCDHPLLEPVGACRQCLVEVAAPARDGVVRPFPKPQTACTMTVSEGMEVKTAATSAVAQKAQEGIVEFLLINHPLDCPICDKGGECPLQNQAMSHGNLHSRFTDAKRTWPKPIELTSQILIDRERCVLCQRCTRFSKQIAGDAFIALQGRGSGSSPRDDHYFMGGNIGAFDQEALDFAPKHGNCVDENTCGCEDSATLDPFVDVVSMSDSAGKPAPVAHLAQIGSKPEEEDANNRLFSSYFSGNIIQICPVGALTSKQYRFRSRPFDLMSTRSVTEHDASGSAIRNDIRRGEVLRRQAQRDMDVNEEWITDKDRFAYHWQSSPARLRNPLVREEEGLTVTSYSDAFTQAAEILKATPAEKVAFLPGGQLTFEDAYAWSKFARKVVGTNHIDQRTRKASQEEEDFLAAFIAGNGMPVTYRDLETAGQVLLVGFEAEDECGSVFLRLRKGVRKGTVKVATLAPWATPSAKKTNAQVVFAAPGTEVEVLQQIEANGSYSELFSALQGENAVIVVGERAGQVPGLLTQVARLAASTQARLAWIPRRAGERGGVEAGLFPGLLPFGRDAKDSESRVDLESVWDCQLPDTVGYDTEKILRASQNGEIETLVIGGLDLRDLPDPDLARKAIANAKKVIVLEVNRTEVLDYADVVLPVAPPAEKGGTFINWEGRLRPFGQALVSHQLSDRDMLNKLSELMERHLDLPSLKAVHAEANQLVNWDGKRRTFQAYAPGEILAPAAGQGVLVCHKQMVDDGLKLAGADDLAKSARRPVARLSEETAKDLGWKPDGEAILKVQTERGEIVLPAVVTQMPAQVVWVPECSPGSHVHETLGITSGSLVNLAMEVK